MTQEIRGIEQSLEDITEFWLSRLNTVLPAFVNSYDHVSQTAEVQPVHAEYFALDDGTKEKQSFPAIPAVPVLHPRSENGFYFHLPIKKGSLVLLLCCQRSIDEWWETDGKTEVVPDELRMHNASDFFALPMGHTDSNKIEGVDANNLILGHVNGDVKMKLEPGGTINMVASTRINLGDETGAKALALAETVNSNFSALKTAYDLHVHTETSTVTLPPSVGLPSASDVSSAKVFTDS